MKQTQTQTPAGGNKTRPRFSKIAVTALLISVAAFTVYMIILYQRVGAIPDTLVSEFFRFATGEAGFLGLIKYGEKKFSDKSDGGSGGAVG